VDQENQPSFRLETKEPSAFWKAMSMWWLAPKRWLLREWETRGDTFFVTMWNGDRYQIQRGRYEAKYDKDQYGRRTLRIKLLDQEKNLRIAEIIPMFPNEREDFDALLAEVGATESWGTKALKVMEVATEGMDRLLGRGR
jgi:hypothetical protein